MTALSYFPLEKSKGEENYTRQVIRRFLKHLDAEKNASSSTIDTYRYDLNKFDDYVAHRLGNRFLPGDVSRDQIRDYLIWLSEVGHQNRTVPPLVRPPWQPYGRFSSMLIEQDC
jgi:site-specific recombinase XerD